MPEVSGFERLPAAAKAWLAAEWRRTGYGDNPRIARELAARLRAADPAADLPSERSVSRWAATERDRQAVIRYAAEFRVATLAALPDGAEALLPRLLADLDAQVYEQIEAARAAGTLDLGTLANAHKALTARQRAITAAEQAALERAKWQAEQAARADERAKAAGAAETAVRAQGMTPEGIAAVRAAIEGAL